MIVLRMIMDKFKAIICANFRTQGQDGDEGQNLGQNNIRLFFLFKIKVRIYVKVKVKVNTQVKGVVNIKV